MPRHASELAGVGVLHLTFTRKLTHTNTCAFSTIKEMSDFMVIGGMATTVADKQNNAREVSNTCAPPPIRVNRQLTLSSTTTPQDPDEMDGGVDAYLKRVTAARRRSTGEDEDEAAAEGEARGAPRARTAQEEEAAALTKEFKAHESEREPTTTHPADDAQWQRTLELSNNLHRKHQQQKGFWVVGFPQRNEKNEYKMSATKDFVTVLMQNGAVRCGGQMEKCASTGRMHFQGFATFASPRLFKVLRGYFMAVGVDSKWGYMNRTKNEKHWATYCSKMETRVDEPWGLPFFHGIAVPPSATAWRTRMDWTKNEETGNYDNVAPWMSDAYKRLLQPKDKENVRQVSWYWSRAGNTGKSTFCYDMYVLMSHLNYNADLGCAVYMSGKSADIKCGLAKVINEEKKNVHLLLIDVPRSMTSDGTDESKTVYVSYSAIEEVTNGIMFAPKYDSAQITMKVSPWVVVFANCPPDRSKLSEDRWHVVCIDKDAVDGKPLAPPFEAASRPRAGAGGPIEILD